jgi:hypothetical protein
MSEHDEHVEDEVEAHHHHRNLANDEGTAEDGEDFELHHHHRNLANDEGETEGEGEGDDFELHHRRSMHHKRNL